MAARAALRSGTGLVTAFVPEKLAPEYAARHPEVMWVGCPVTSQGGLAAGAAELVRTRSGKATALLIGPGLGADPETITLAAQLAGEATMPLVLDADALRPEVVARVLAKSFIGTPHAGE
jgi:NAD(P)H-hydrate repair Nnr-like enzyme with NAD(P)H-hydrate dehydratase domain